MFTGIIEEIGKVIAFDTGAGGASIRVGAAKVLEETRVGDSIAVDGVCLTVTSASSESFTADILDETLRKSNLQEVKVGSEVNLERSLTPSSRLGGHFVLGHVDRTARILRKYLHGADTVLEIELPDELKPFVAPKGSIAINGISLTVVDVKEKLFSVYLIPQTLQETNLKNYRTGDVLNIEIDILARYIYNFSQKQGSIPSKITESFLAEKGFL